MTCFTSCETLELVRKHNYIEIFRCLIFKCIFMPRRAIPMIADCFPTGSVYVYIYNYIYIYVCVTYVSMRYIRS